MTQLTEFIAALRKVLRDDTRAALNTPAFVTTSAQPRRCSPRRTVSSRLPGYRPERGPARFMRRRPSA